MNRTQLYLKWPSRALGVYYYVLNLLNRGILPLLIETVPLHSPQAQLTPPVP